MLRRRPRRPIYLDLHLPKLPRRASLMLSFLLISGVLAAVTVQSTLYLRELTHAMAISDATDIVTATVNDTLSKMMRSDYDYDYFVSLERDNSGAVTAISTNMARVNALSAEILNEIISTSANGALDIEIPIGNLLGSSLLLGRGPDVPVQITMLTSSRIDLANELTAAGINQTKHQIKLLLTVDIDVILPWETSSTQVISEVLIAETVVVGSVPETYFYME